MVSSYPISRNPAIAVGVPVTIGIATGFLTRESKYGPRSAWYKSLSKASLNPPNWTFGVVWPLLYASMGYASHLTVKALDRTPPGFGRRAAELSMTLYYTQLALNTIWTPLNFGIGNLALALVDIVALTGTVGWWCLSLRDVDQTASNLVIPYVAWSVYATYLNAALWYKNSGKYFVQNLKKDAKDLKKEAKK